MLFVFWLEPAQERVLSLKPPTLFKEGGRFSLNLVPQTQLAFSCYFSGIQN